MNAAGFLNQVRQELAAVNKRVEEHPMLAEAEQGVLSIDAVRLFIENQYYIVHHDLRSLSLMVSRAQDEFEISYLNKLQQGDLTAFEELKKLGAEVGAALTSFPKLRIIPEAVSYTHYLAWLALYGNTGEQVFALIVNLPVWGHACARLGKALREKYGVKNTGFLDGFANLPNWVEQDGLKIIEKYIQSSGDRMRMIAKTIQSYEISFWDAVYRGV